ncbi:hypothetical protein ZIOFF_024256 [Zingiber officinale]|uniref:Uncharacterized protein n=1 Tax=Zingiber officinale TaxID=94328 RepID=A0A8J5LD18_ZINOF|nr:hypothetical protein ZIOFF_024256 [Zingiber officinale]
MSSKFCKIIQKSWADGVTSLPPLLILQGGVCLAFADEVLCWLYGTVKENEDYILQFLPPFHRLELLRAESCPDAITDHVEQI